MNVILSISVLVLAVAGRVAHADFDITIQQVGNDVVMTGSGDLQASSSLRDMWCGYAAGYVDQKAICIGNDEGGKELTGILFSPLPSLTDGTSNIADSATGDFFGLKGNNIYIPVGYQARTPINGSSTFNNNTLADMGLTEGTTTLQTADDVITITIGQSTTETTDSDGDGVEDNGDQCANTPSSETADNAGCGPSQTDSDGDGANDDQDSFPNDPTETADSDNDGVGDNADAFPNDPTRSALPAIPVPLMPALVLLLLAGLLGLLGGRRLKL